MYILGVWDGHDAGAALIDQHKIIFAANEERYTRRKLEVGFPRNAIQAALSFSGVNPTEITDVAFATTDISKTMERIFPRIKENYYSFRRRKSKPAFEHLRHRLKYNITTTGNLPGTRTISSYMIRKQLHAVGIKKFKLHVIDHHNAHMASASMTSGMNKQMTITMDGLGDGYSASVNVITNGKIEERIRIGAKDSLGVFFEQATNIIGMRELEDEGKLMAMADYSYPFDMNENRFKDFFIVEGARIRSRYSPGRQYQLLRDAAWSMPREQFAFMVQQLTQAAITKFVGNCINRFNMQDISFAGGIFSNIKANMSIRMQEELKHWYVFPHMGDGGLALGSALYARFEKLGFAHYDMHAYLGDEYSEEYTDGILAKERAFKYEKMDNKSLAQQAAQLISQGHYVLWFNGRMEYGPRALGNRSILASAQSEYVKEQLNIHIKKREWFQPFAPSIIEDDINRIIKYDGKGMDKFMTMAYNTRDGVAQEMKSVVHIDGTARVQAVGEENSNYAQLLEQVKKACGIGIVLNTSFNIHGYPIVRSPEDAIKMMHESKTKYMFINGYFVTNRRGN